MGPPRLQAAPHGENPQYRNQTTSSSFGRSQQRRQNDPGSSPETEKSGVYRPSRRGKQNDNMDRQFEALGRERRGDVITKPKQDDDEFCEWDVPTDLNYELPLDTNRSADYERWKAEQKRADAERNGVKLDQAEPQEDPGLTWDSSNDSNINRASKFSRFFQGDSVPPESEHDDVSRGAHQPEPPANNDDFFMRLLNKSSEQQATSPVTQPNLNLSFERQVETLQVKEAHVNEPQSSHDGPPYNGPPPGLFLPPDWISQMANGTFTPVPPPPGMGMFPPSPGMMREPPPDMSPETANGSLPGNGDSVHSGEGSIHHEPVGNLQSPGAHGHIPPHMLPMIPPEYFNGPIPPPMRYGFPYGPMGPPPPGMGPPNRIQPPPGMYPRGPIPNGMPGMAGIPGMNGMPGMPGIPNDMARSGMPPPGMNGMPMHAMQRGMPPVMNGYPMGFERPDMFHMMNGQQDQAPAGQGGTAPESHSN